MKTIKIDTKVYETLLSKVSDFGETPNTVLRRLLDISDEPKKPKTKEAQSPEEALLDSADFRFARGVVGRFLAVLAWIYREDPDSFSLVENIHGRGRLYFAKSATALEKSGKSVNPKQIPDTPYWVITTTPTDLKQDIIRKIMKWQKYNNSAIELITQAIAK